VRRSSRKDWLWTPGNSCFHWFGGLLGLVWGPSQGSAQPAQWAPMGPQGDPQGDPQFTTFDHFWAPFPACLGDVKTRQFHGLARHLQTGWCFSPGGPRKSALSRPAKVCSGTCPNCPDVKRLRDVRAKPKAVFSPRWSRGGMVTYTSDLLARA